MSHRSEPTCPCGTPIDGATLCQRCTTTLAWALANIAAYHTDLDTLRCRQARYTDPAPLRRGGGPIPLPVDPRFTDPQGSDPDTGTLHGTGTDLAWTTRNTTTTWVRHLLEQHPHLPGPRHPTVTGCCAWLMTHLHRIRVNEAGPEILDELLDLEHQLRRMVDRPPPKIYLGLCTVPTCTGSVYAREGETTGTCDADDCDAEYSAEASRQQLQDALDSQLCTAAEIADLSTYLGLDAGREQVRKRINVWHTRHRILPAAHTPDGEPLFRYSHVRVLLYRELGDTQRAG